MPQKFSSQTPRQKILYQLEKANYFPLKHHALLEAIPRSISASTLLEELVKLEEEGLILKGIDSTKGKIFCFYTLSEEYTKQASFQIPRFVPNL